jgi:hypothetical protein
MHFLILWGPFLFVQREAVEALIQELPKFRLKAVPTDCSECPICLEEFHVGNEVKQSHCLAPASIVIRSS